MRRSPRSSAWKRSWTPIRHRRAGAALREAILARAPGARSRWRDALREFWAALGGMRIAGPAFAAALVLGLSLGATMAASDGDADEDVDLVALAQFSDDYLDY